MASKTPRESKAAAAARVTASLPVLEQAGFDYSASRATTIATLRAAVGNTMVITDPAKRAFYVGTLRAILRVDHDAASRVLDARGATGTGKLKDGERRRTPAEEKAYGAARSRLTSLLAEAGIKTNDARGGARKPKAPAPAKEADASGEADAANAATRKAMAEEDIKGPGDIHAFVIQQAAALLAFCEKRKAATPPAVLKVVMAFRKAAMAMPAPR